MLSILLTLLIIILIYGLVWYLFTIIPLPPQFLKLAQIVIAIALVLTLISLLLGYVPRININ